MVMVIALVVTSLPASSSMKVNGQAFKKFVLKSAAAMSSLGLMANTAVADMVSAPFDDKIRYEVVTAGKGDQPKIGDLVSIRFKASYKGKEFDTPQPYMYRAG
jgi:FKBP-type peptidyl-prolyl cis-trans isomerase